MKALFIFTFLIISVAAHAGGEPRVALMDFSSDDNLYRSAEAAARFTAAVQARLAGTSGVVWVERQQLDLAAQEFHLHRFGFASDAAVLRLGRWLKADLLVRGRFERRVQKARVLRVEVIDPQRADVVVTRELSVSGDARDPLTLSTPDLERAAIELAGALAESRKAFGAGGTQRRLGVLFFRNLSSTPRLDFLESDIFDQFAQAGALRFPRASESFAESELSVLSLTDTSPDAWKQIADVYVWGSYEELPAKETAFEQIRVALTFNLWDGHSTEQTLQATGTVVELSHAIAGMISKARDAVDHHPPGEPSATVRDDIAARLMERARTVSNPLHQVRLLEVASFFAPQSQPIRRALLDAKWKKKVAGTYAALSQQADDFEHYLANFDASKQEQITPRLAEVYRGMLVALHFRREQAAVPLDLPDAVAEEWQRDVTRRISALVSQSKSAAPSQVVGDLLHHVLECVDDPAARLSAVETLWPSYKKEYVKSVRQNQRGSYVMRDIEQRLYQACAEAGEPERIKTLLEFESTPPSTNAPSSKRAIDYVALWKSNRSRPMLQRGEPQAATNSLALPELGPVMRRLRFDRDTAVFGRPGDAHDRVSSLAYAAGQLWIGSEHVTGGQRADAAQFFRYDLATDELTNLAAVSRINAMLPDGSSLWIATDDNGAARLDLKSGAVTNFTSRDGVLSPQVSAIAVVGDRIFAGGGALKLNFFDRSTQKWGDFDTGDARGEFVASGHWLLFRKTGGRLVDVKTHEVRRLPEQVTAAAADASGFWLTTRQEILHLDPDTGQTKRWPHPLGLVQRLLPDGGLLWVATDSQVALWDIPGEQWRGAFHVDGKITSLVASPRRLWIGRDHETEPVIEVESPNKIVADPVLTDLWHAAYEGQLDAVDRFLASGADINAATKRDWTPLMAAIRGGQMAAVHRLVERGAKTTPASLVLAAEIGDADVIKLLLRGDTPADTAWREQTPLLAAAAHGNVEVARQLIAKGADQYQENQQGKTALALAVSTGNRSMTRLLLDARPKADPRPADLTSMVDLAVKRGHAEIVGELLERGVAVNASDGSCPILMLAAESGNLALARVASQHGATIDGERATRLTIASDPTVWNVRETALALAAENGHLEMMDLLIEAGLKPDKKLRDGTVGGQAMIRAATRNQILAVEKLLQTGVPIDERDDNGMTALMWTAKMGGSPAATQLLLERRANRELRNRQGKSAADLAERNEIRKLFDAQTAPAPPTAANPWLLSYELGEAAEAGDLAVLDALLVAGADFNSRVPYNTPALARAAATGHDAAVERLLDRGADINATGPGGWTALMLAAGNGHQATVALLTRRGAAVNQENDWGQMARDIAGAHGHRDVAIGLERAGKSASDGRMLIDGVRMRNPALVKLLLDSGEPVNGVDSSSRTALFHAVHKYDLTFYGLNASASLETVQLLLTRGADINHIDDEGQTPLMAAVTHEDVFLDVIKFLVDHGARVDARNRAGATAVELARSIRNAGQREAVLQVLNAPQGTPRQPSP